MENCVGAAETWWVWTGGSTSSKDTCSEIWGDGTDAAVKDGAATVIENSKFIKRFRWRLKKKFVWNTNNNYY